MQQNLEKELKTLQWRCSKNQEKWITIVKLKVYKRRSNCARSWKINDVRNTPKITNLRWKQDSDIAEICSEKQRLVLIFLFLLITASRAVRVMVLCGGTHCITETSSFCFQYRAVEGLSWSFVGDFRRFSLQHVTNEKCSFMWISLNNSFTEQTALYQYHESSYLDNDMLSSRSQVTHAWTWW